MTKRADLWLNTLFWTNWCTLLKIAYKWCTLPATFDPGGSVTRAKMTKRADLGLFWTNSCTLLEIAKKWCAQCENDKTC